MDSSRSRTTRSRSRSLMPNGAGSSTAGTGAGVATGRARERPQQEDVPASATAADASAAAPAPRKTHVAAVDTSDAAAPASSSSASAAVVDGSSGRKDYCSPLPSEHEFYWCSGPPTLTKVSAHLDRLTGDSLRLAAAHQSLSESFRGMQGTLQALMDSNQRLRREVRQGKVDSTRRWFWGLVLLLALTLGRDFLKGALLSLVWALEFPAEALPLLLSNLQVMSTYGWLLAAPLTLALFAHSMLNAHAAGRMGLGRTVLALVAGVGMQVPLLYFLMRAGAFQLAALSQSPLFESAMANGLFTVALWVAVALLDYTLIVMHYYIE